MGKPTTQATKPEAAKATEQVTEQATSAASEQAGEQSATEAAAEEAAATEAAAKTSAPKSNLYTVASPIKHDGQDYAAGDPIRLPEATAHRLAGYLKA